MKTKRLLSLSALVICITGCNGGGGPSAKKQNFIYGNDGKLLGGKVFLNIGSTEEFTERFKDIEFPKDAVSGTRKGYESDTRRSTGNNLTSISYDIDKTGSFTYNFDMKQDFKKFLDEDGELINDSYLNLYFEMDTNNKIKYLTISENTMEMVCKYDYTENGKTEEHEITYVDYFSTGGQYVQTNAILLNSRIDRIKNKNDNIDNISNARLIFTGYIVASFEYKE